MAFTSKKARELRFHLNEAYNLGPGVYTGSLNSTAVEESIIPFNSSVPRKLTDQETIDPIAEEKLRLRNEFAYESKIIRAHLRREVPDAGFHSQIKRLPTAYLENAPDPGTFYQDPVSTHIQKMAKKEKVKQDYSKAREIIKSKFPILINRKSRDQFPQGHSPERAGQKGKIWLHIHEKRRNPSHRGGGSKFQPIHYRR
jgi:hypothetical protein